MTIQKRLLTFLIGFIFVTFYIKFFEYYSYKIISDLRPYISNDYQISHLLKVLTRRIHILYFIGCISSCIFTSILVVIDKYY
jgi:hypothetical protein